VASELIARAELSGADHERLERSQWLGHMVLLDGVATRDQRPMPETPSEIVLKGGDSVARTLK
jgi:hypothetical protein